MLNRIFIQNYKSKDTQIPSLGITLNKMKNMLDFIFKCELDENSYCLSIILSYIAKDDVESSREKGKARVANE